MLAGNVNVTVSADGDVTIRGDAQANWIYMTYDDGTDELEIDGEDTGITLDGVTSDLQEVSVGGHLQRVKILMAGGDDFLRFNGGFGSVGEVLAVNSSKLLKPSRSESKPESSTPTFNPWRISHQSSI